MGDVYASQGAPDRPFALAICEADLPVAVALGRVIDETWEIERLIVGVSHRNAGLGGLLLREIEAQARLDGAERLRLVVRVDSAARGFYARYGFAELNTLVKWRRHRDFVLMERALA